MGEEDEDNLQSHAMVPKAEINNNVCGMEKTSLKNDKSIFVGGITDEFSSCAEKKWIPKSNTCSDNLKKNVLGASRRGTSVMENKTDSGLIFKGESSFTPSMADLNVDDRIASLLTSCTLEDDPVLEEKKNKVHECGSISPGRSLTVRPKKKLLVLNMNGLLADIVNGYHTSCRAQKRIVGKTIFKRPFCDEFLKFCFEKFDVGVWSSRRKHNVDSLVDYLLEEFKNKLLFVWDQSKCTGSGFRSLENRYKPLFLKELNKLWNKEETGLPWKKGVFSPSNTLLLDNSPYKALLNPLHTAIFPDPYHYDDREDNSLGPGGDIRVYLEQLVMANDVQQYVKEHPFGQSPITASHKQWNFYSVIIKRFSAELS